MRNLYACRTLTDINDNSICCQLVEQQSADAVLTFMCVLLAVFGAVLTPVGWAKMFLFKKIKWGQGDRKTHQIIEVKKIQWLHVFSNCVFCVDLVIVFALKGCVHRGYATGEIG